MWDVLMDDVQEPSPSSSRPDAQTLVAPSTFTNSSSTQSLTNPSLLDKPPPASSESTRITTSNAALSQLPTNSAQPITTTSNPPKKSHKYNPQKAPRMKMMDDDIEIDVRRKKKKPSSEPVGKTKVIHSPVERREERRGTSAISSDRGAGGASFQEVGRSTSSSMAEKQDPRSGWTGTGAAGGRDGKDVDASNSNAFATTEPRSREGPLSLSRAVASEPVSHTSIQDVLDEFDLPPGPIIAASPQAQRPSVQIPSSRIPNPRDPRLFKLSIKIPDQPSVASPSHSSTSTQPSASAATLISTSHPSAASTPPTTPPQLAEQPSKKPEANSHLPPELSSSWLDEIKGSNVVVLRSSEDKKNKNVFKAITSTLRERGCTLLAMPPPDQPPGHLSLPDIILGSTHTLTPEVLLHLDWIVDMRRAGTRFFVFRWGSTSVTEENEAERKMVELGGGGKSLLCFSPSALSEPRDTMEALETNLLLNLHLLAESWSIRMLPEVVSHLQSCAGVRDGDGAKKRTLQQVSTASFLHQAFDEIRYSSSAILPDFTSGTTSQERDAHTVFELRLQSPLVDTYDGLLRVCQDVSRPEVKRDLGRATRLELQKKQMDPAFVEEYRRFIFVTNEKFDPRDCGESWEGIEVLTFAELDQEIRLDLEDLGIEAVSSTWGETKEWVGTHF